jgi:type I restriction enzyme S subunit
LKKFTNIVKPNFAQIGNLMQQNKKLAEGRDLLLPRLMNGEIEV